MQSTESTDPFMIYLRSSHGPGRTWAVSPLAASWCFTATSGGQLPPPHAWSWKTLPQAWSLIRVAIALLKSRHRRLQTDSLQTRRVCQLPALASEKEMRQETPLQMGIVPSLAFSAHFLTLPQNQTTKYACSGGEAGQEGEAV